MKNEDYGDLIERLINAAEDRLSKAEHWLEWYDVSSLAKELVPQYIDLTRNKIEIIKIYMNKK